LDITVSFVISERERCRPVKRRGVRGDAEKYRTVYRADLSIAGIHIPGWIRKWQTEV